MFSQKFYAVNPIASALNVTEHLEICIPRMGADFDEQDIKNIFLAGNIGCVLHVDFVEFVPKETTATATASVIASVAITATAPPAKMYSAFVKFSHWFSSAVPDAIAKSGSYKFFVSATLYWLLLPNKNPLARTKLNIHQLASYSEEMHVKIDAQAIIFTEQETRIAQQEEQNARQAEQIAKLLEINDTQTKQIAEQNTSINRLFELCEFQNKQVSELQYAVSMIFSSSQEDEDEYDDLPDLISENDVKEQPKLHIEELTEKDVSHVEVVLLTEDLQKFPMLPMVRQANYFINDNDDTFTIEKEMKREMERLEINIDMLPPCPKVARRVTQWEINTMRRSRTPSPEKDIRLENSRDLCGNA